MQEKLSRADAMLVQIYEVRTPEEAAAVARLGVDHVGVLVGDGSFPRELPALKAREIFAGLPPGTRGVALSLSPDRAEIARVIEIARPDVIHLGAAIELLSAADTRAPKAKWPEMPMMRSIPIVDEASIEWAQAYRGTADFLLLDSHDPGDRQIGARGRTHDWRLSRRIVVEIGIPVILAGGLDADNVGAAIAAVGPAGVDSKPKPTAPMAPARTSTGSGASSPPPSSPDEAIARQQWIATLLRFSPWHQQQRGSSRPI